MLDVLFGIIIVVGLAAAVVVGLAWQKPDSFRVSRSIEIAAPPETVAPFIDNFREWMKWSPYEGKDPAMERRYEGPTQGPGAIYHWSGTSKVGTGRMEIVDASPSRISIKLDFLKPFEGHNIADFTMQPAVGLTRVTWAMHGPAPLMSKVMQVFMNMDTMIGKDFEVGLANLKSVAEQSVSPSSANH